MMKFQRKVLLVLFVAMNMVNINSGSKKRAFPASYGPNFDPEYPSFGPFNAHEFIAIDHDLSAENDGDDATSDTDDYYAVVAPATTAATATPFHAIQSPPMMSPAKGTEFNARIKPLKNFVMGLYQNYRTTYMGNQSISAADGDDDTSDAGSLPVEHMNDFENRLDDVVRPKKPKRKLKLKKKHLNSIAEDELRYNVGPGVNVSLDTGKELVNVFLDEDCLKDIFTGRGRKHDLISKILPLFILPFLIQSAIVPFVVTTLKLLLIKSIVVGKIAIFLLVISAFKNNHKYSGGYETPPAYIVDPPSRRSEMAPAVGYRVEGKPTTWVN